MKKNARTAPTLDSMTDAQIGALVDEARGMESLMGNISAPDMTAQEMAVLSISRDLRSLLRELGIIREKTEMFETFARSLQSQITALGK